jgi:hypothetical protein
MSRNSTLWPVAVIVLGIGIGLNAFRPAAGVAGPNSVHEGGAKYTVIDTEGTNLLVVDNSNNNMYYYTVDQGKQVGDDLILRGLIDLNQVGKPVVKPKPVGAEKKSDTAPK